MHFSYQLSYTRIKILGQISLELWWIQSNYFILKLLSLSLNLFLVVVIQFLLWELLNQDGNFRSKKFRILLIIFKLFVIKIKELDPLRSFLVVEKSISLVNSPIQDGKFRSNKFRILRDMQSFYFLFKFKVYLWELYCSC